MTENNGITLTTAATTTNNVLTTGYVPTWASVEPYYSGIIIGDILKQTGGKDMLYLIGAVRENDDSGVKKIVHKPEAFVAASENDAKMKAITRWGVGEEEIDDLEIHAIQFHVV